MKNKIALTIFLTCCSLICFGQNIYKIKGTVRDTMATYNLENASVVVIHQKDSVLVKHTLADAKGIFAINAINAGKYILLLSYPGYADYMEQFTLDTLNPVKDFGNIDMILKSTLLNDVIIRGKAAAIKINGDTTEFNAGSYIIKPNSKVEDLLKQLPGIQVDKNGQITAQGKTVTRVLVDGEEFFGDDPTLVTRNIRGDMVDKVQLFDKKSDLTTFTGIDDGKREKTLNVKLKEDKKTGYFGKMASAYGTKDFHESQAMVNIFRNKEKIAAYGAISNTGSVGLSMGDAGKYSTSDTEYTMVNDGIGGTRMVDAESFKGTYDGRGLPLAKGGGLHYENKWGQDKYALNSNYRLGSLGVNGTGNEFTVNNLPGQITRTNSDRQFNNNAFRQKLDAAIQVQLDSLSTLRFALAGALKRNRSNESFNTYTLREDGTFQNKSVRELSNEGKERNFYANALWNKRLGKPGRTLSVNIRQSAGSKESTGLLSSLNEFFDQNNIRYQADSIDQYKNNKTTTRSFSSNIVYTEPIWKSLNVMLNYELNLGKGKSSNQSLNKDAAGNYTLPDEAFSSNFSLDQVSHTGGAIFNYQAGKSILNFGTKIENISYKQYDILGKDKLTRNFTNWNPQVTYSYQVSKDSKLDFSYNGKANQPDVNQIQPLRVNINPLYEILGNPQLRPSFNSSFNLSYTSYKTIGAKLLSLFGSYVFTTDPISSSTITDETGKTLVQAINLKDRTPINYYFQINTSRVIQKINVGMNGGVSGFTNYNLSNNLLNTAITTRYFAGPTLSRFAEKFDFRFSVQPFYNTTRLTLQESVNNNQWGITGNFNSTVPVPGKLALTVSANYEYNGRTQAFDDALNRLILDVDIYKTFFKNESLRITLYGKDLLDQNNGFIRNVNNNMIRQEYFSTIRRYFLLALSWDFSKMGGSTTKN